MIKEYIRRIFDLHYCFLLAVMIVFSGSIRRVFKAFVKGGFRMAKFECVCGYVYDEEAGDPDNGINPGTKFEDLPDDWTCPVCDLPKSEFSPV